MLHAMFVRYDVRHPIHVPMLLLQFEKYPWNIKINIAPYINALGKFGTVLVVDDLKHSHYKHKHLLHFAPYPSQSTLDLM